MNFIENKQNDLKTMLENAALKAGEMGELNFETLPDFVIEMPKDRTHGDFATNIAMLLARQAKKAPRAIAEIILANIVKTDDIATIEIAGAGFINFKMQKSYMANGVKDALKQGMDFGNSTVGNGKKVQVEFVSANPTGELHMGNARGAAIGDTLANLLRTAGFEVEKEFYINDAGNQIERFGESLEARYLQQFGEDVPFPEDGYHGEDINRTMADFIAETGETYRNTESSERRLIMIDYALNKKITAIREALSRFGVHYDVWFSELTLHENGAVTKAIETLTKNGHTFEKDGAIWFNAQDFGAEKPEVLVRANGIPTYYAADIAYHINKFERGFDRVINIWGADHHGHVARIKGAVTAAGYAGNNIDVILMQLVRLLRNGEIVKMSKRAGTYVTLEELMDEVGVDAGRFFFGMRNADSQMDFDLDLAVAQNSDNPVFYVQYAHARINSILRQAAEQNITLAEIDDIDFTLLQEDSETMLIRKILDLPSDIAYIAINAEAHKIAQTATDIASLFHTFYNNCRVIGVDNELQQARLGLCKLTANTIAKILGIMGVTAPEKM